MQGPGRNLGGVELRKYKACHSALCSDKDGACFASPEEDSNKNAFAVRSQDFVRDGYRVSV